MPKSHPVYSLEELEEKVGGMSCYSQEKKCPGDLNRPRLRQRHAYAVKLFRLQLDMIQALDRHRRGNKQTVGALSSTAPCARLEHWAIGERGGRKFDALD